MTLLSSLLNRLLTRWGASFVWRITLPCQIVSFLAASLGVYYIILNVTMNQAQFLHLVGSVLVLVAIANVLVMVHGYRITPQARTGLAAWAKTLETGPDQTAQALTDEAEQEAWREITSYPWRFAKYSALVAFFQVILPAALYMYLVAGIGFLQAAHIVVGGIIAAASLIVYLFFVLEGAMSPARRVLLPRSPTQQHEGLAGIGVHTRLFIVHSTLVLILLLMVGTLSYQKAANALVPGVDLAANLRSLQSQLALISLAAVLFNLGFSYLLARSVSRPINHLAQTMAYIEAGQLGQRAEVTSTDELGHLTIAFNQMISQLESLRASLEQRITERTSEAERRAAQIATGAEIARAATTVLNPDQLIASVVQLIQERFKYYYVGLFLIDAENRFAVLHYGIGAGSASQAGRIMKERGHKLEIGGNSMIGWACANRRARIALDVGQDAVRFANPLTPDTRSELALPLRAGERVVGAFTIQSTQTAAFDQDDIAALQGMADQVAIALENARLFTQTQTALQELEETNRLMMRQGWQSYLEQRSAVRRAEFGAVAKTPSTGPLAHPLTIPIELRGQPMGKVTLRRGGDRPWSNDEIELVKAIALQTSLAADNARLMEQTQLTLQETEELYQAAQEITAATGIEGIAQILTQRFNDMSKADRTIMFLIDQKQKSILHKAGHGNIKNELQTSYEELNQGISGMALQLGRPILSLSADDGIEPEETRERRKADGAGALIVVPLAIKGQPIGTITTIHRLDQRKVAQHDVDLLMALAAQATTAIENLRLLEQTQRRAEREQLIRQVTTRIRAAGDIEGVLQTTATELAQTLRVPRAIVRLTTGGKTKQDE